MARDRTSSGAPGGDPDEKCPVHRGGVRFVRVPIGPPTGEMRDAPGGGDRLIAALANLVRSAMAADAAAGAISPPPSVDDKD